MILILTFIFRNVVFSLMVKTCLKQQGNIKKQESKEGIIPKKIYNINQVSTYV